MTDRDEEQHLLTGAYSLDALSGREKRDFEAYLEGSEEARAEVASLTDTAVQLGLAAEPVAPPSDLKARLMAQIAVTPQLPVDKSDAAAAPSASPSQADTRAESPAEAKARARWHRRPATYLIAAAAALVLFFGGAVFGTTISNHGVGQQQASNLVELSSAADLQRAEANVTGGGTATLIWSLDQRRSALIVDDLPTLPSGKVYELWYMDKAGAATPAGTFEPAGTGKMAHVLVGKMSGGDTVGITVEPSGGSEKPTTNPIVAIAS